MRVNRGKKEWTYPQWKTKSSLPCLRPPFVLDPQQKIITDQTKSEVRQALLERVSLEGICRIFSVSMPWLLSFIQQIIYELPDDLNATVVKDYKDFEVAIIELDEQWSYVGNKKNQQWLWLAFHSASRQVLAMHVGKRDKRAAEALLAKLPEDLKKKPSFTLIGSLCTTKSFLGSNTRQSEKIQEKRVTLKDLTTP
ncbi:putative transposase [Waddlia chondrophila 2032/99]|uniref:Putative transposase n=1 Tax=Waddlia chondrophila 2032/99 TaxID=765953 RepID=F8LE61_9BACT|nr:putative transposase [Waddlia chondrophila 2032/99]